MSARGGPAPWVLAALALGCGAPADDSDVVRIGVAASAAPAVREAARAFAAGRPGVDVRTHAAGSGILMQQVRRGAPIDVLISASPAEIDRLIEAGLAVAGSRVSVASNRLVLVTPTGGPTSATLSDLADPFWSRIAVANPDTAPLGRYTHQALDAAGVTGAVRDRLVYGESARHVREWVRRGEATVGILYATDARNGGLRVVDEVPGEMHDPIRYEAVVVRSAAARGPAGAFVEWLASADGRRVLARHGFD